MAKKKTSQKESGIENFIQKATSDKAIDIWAQFLQDVNNREKIDFSKAIENALSTVSNPFLQNQRVKNLFGRETAGLDREVLEKAVTSPESHEDVLRNYSKGINYASYPMLKKNRVYSDILTYHSYSIPVSAESKEDWESDVRIISSWERCFNPKYQFRRIASQVAIEGKAAYYYRQVINTTKTPIEPINFERGQRTVKAAFLEKLPNEWWKIVGFTDTNYYRVSFNFMYFLQPGVSLEFFDDFFKNTYNQLMGYVEEEENLDIPIRKRRGVKRDSSKIQGTSFKIRNEIELPVNLQYEDGKWYYWAELPSEKCFVFSEQEATALAAPSSLGVFLQARDLDSYALLQQQLSSLPLNSMVVGEIPFHNNNLSGNTNNDFRVDMDTMFFFNRLFDQTAPTGTGVQGLPYTNLKLIQFDGVTNSSDIYLKAVQQFLISTGMGSLFTLTDKPNAIQVKTAQVLESRYSDYLYEQFNNFVNLVYKIHLNLNGIWRYSIFGDVFSDKDTLASLKDGLSLGQSYLLPKYMAMFDVDMNDATVCMDFINNFGIYDKFKTVQSSYNVSDKGGRPASDLEDSESDATIRGIDNLKNEEG